MQLPTLQHLCLPPPPLPLHCSNRERTPSPPPPLTTSTTNPLRRPNLPPPPLPTLHHSNRERRGFACHQPLSASKPSITQNTNGGVFLPQGHHITLSASSVAGNVSGGGFLVLVNFFVYKYLFLIYISI